MASDAARRPKTRLGRPERPALLSGEAAREWDRVVAVLYEAGTIATTDLRAVEGYCLAWDSVRRIREKFAKKPMVVNGSTGSPVMAPWVRMEQQALRELRGWLAELGMTPASRERVSRVEQDAKNDEAKRFFAS